MFGTGDDAKDKHAFTSFLLCDIFFARLPIHRLSVERIMLHLSNMKNFYWMSQDN